MIKDTQNKKRGACRSIMGLVFLGFLIFGLFNGFSVKTAQAVNFENNFIDKLKLYYTIENDLVFEFHCKTSWTPVPYLYYPYRIFRINYSSSRAYAFYENVDLAIIPNLVDNYFIAGNTYKIYTKYTKGTAGGVTDYLTKARWEYWKGSPLTSSDFISTYGATNFWTNATGGIGQTKLANYEEIPFLTISYPQNNMEIAESFDIQGSYTLPAGSGYNILMAGFFKAGTYDINWNKAVNVFSIPVSEPSGSFDNLRVSNYVPKDIYDIYFRFYGAGVSYELPFHISNINIVSDLPYELPITGETPLVIPSFTTPSAQKIYEDYSNYDTPTPLFNIITGAIEPISQTIGDNLTFFSSRFNITNAKEAGEKAGDAVLIIRANAGIINSFFNDLPIAEILFLYLSALVAVIVFRLIRLLIKLIPFV